MLVAFLVGLLVFILANFFIEAGLALLLGVIAGILVYLNNGGNDVRRL